MREDDAYSICRPFPGTCEPPLQGLYTLLYSICMYLSLRTAISYDLFDGYTILVLFHLKLEAGIHVYVLGET